MSLFVSSKFEDVIPIHMDQILKDAGHGKFGLKEVVEMEKDIFMTLSFKV